MSTRTRAGAAVAAVGLLATLALVVHVPTAPATALAARGDQSATERISQTPRRAEPGPSPGPEAAGLDQGDPGRKPRGPDADEWRRQQEAFTNRLAGNLGIEPARLSEAMKKTHVDLANQAVLDGTMAQEQADRLIQRINAGQAGGFGPHGPGPKPGSPAMGGPKAGLEGLRFPAMVMAAQSLGMTPPDLRAELRGAKSLAEVAQGRGVSRGELEQRMVAAHRAALDEAVSRGDMTADRANQVAARFAGNVGRLLDAKPGQRQVPRP